jgi:glycerate dehydrogenase
MKVVITDGFTLNPGDLSWDIFYSLGEVTYYDRSSPEQVMERCCEAVVIVTNKTPITQKVIEAADNLKIIAVTATGYNIIDMMAAKKRGVLVCNVPEYGTYSVAQHAFALLLELSNRVCIHSQSVYDGNWSKAIDWCFSKTPIIELKDKTLGIIGLGRIGLQTARIAHAFGMNIIYHRGNRGDISAESVSLEELFSKSDFVSLHCPLRPDNASFVDRALLMLMKPTAFLINTSRGQLINEEDLADALKNKVLAGAALDVLSKEPPPENNPLLHLPNCLITPHNAWMSVEARKRILNTSYENVKAALAGRPQNIVS